MHEEDKEQSCKMSTSTHKIETKHKAITKILARIIKPLNDQLLANTLLNLNVNDISSVAVQHSEQKESSI